MIALTRHEQSEAAPLTNTCMMSPAESFLQVSAASGVLVAFEIIRLISLQ